MRPITQAYKRLIWGFQFRGDVTRAIIILSKILKMTEDEFGDWYDIAANVEKEFVNF
jgi:hypothetical protein